MSLTRRESDVLQLVAHGMSNKQIGASLGISTFTVKNYMRVVFRKLGVENRTQAALMHTKRDPKIQVWNDVDAPYDYFQIRESYNENWFSVKCYVHGDLFDKVMDIAKLVGENVEDKRSIPGRLLR